MKTVKWILTILLILNSSLLNAFDMVGTTFIEYVRYVSNTNNINIIIDENIKSDFHIIIPDKVGSKDLLKTLKSVLSKNKLYLKKYGSVYYIDKIEDGEEYYHSVKLKYILPDKIIPIIKQHNKKVTISKSKKTIIFYCLENEAKKIKKLIELLDQPTKSKNIKITLLSFKDKDLSEFGLNMDVESINNLNTIQYKSLISGLVSSQSLLFNLPNFNLDLYISDLKTKSLVDLKFSPVLSLFDNEITNFDIVQNIPYLSDDRSIDGTNDIQSNNYTYKDVGSSISIDKVAITDDAIYFHIKMTYAVILDKSLTPTTAKRTIDNYIKLKNGESVLIAGIKTDEIRTVHREIPLLSSIPVLGDVFKWDSNTKSNDTFAVFISNVDNNQSYDQFMPEATTQVKRAPALAGK